MLPNQWWGMKNLKNQQPMHGTSHCCMILNLHPYSWCPQEVGCCSSPAATPSYLWYYSYMHSLDATLCDSRCIWSSPTSSWPCPCKDSNLHLNIWVFLAPSCLTASNPWIFSYPWMDSKPLLQDLGIYWIWWCPYALAYLDVGSNTPWSLLVLAFSNFEKLACQSEMC